MPGHVRIERQSSELTPPRRRAAELASLLESVDTFVAEIARDGTIAYVNRPREVFQSCARCDRVGERWDAWVDPAFGVFAGRALDQLFRTGTATRFECRARDARWYEVRLRPIVRDGAVAAAALTADDVTDRRSLDDQLARSLRAHAIRSELRGLMLEAADEGALYAQVRELLVSDAGFVRVAVRPATPGAPRDRGDALELEGLSHRAAPIPAEERAEGPGLAVPIYDGPHLLGALLAWAAADATLDDTDAWLLSDVARDLAHGIRAIRARGERRTMEELLFQAQKMDAIGQLAGGVAHDFNNQLTGILGFAECLTMQLDDDHLKEEAQHILRAAERSADLTAQLLAFARRGPFESATFDVHSVLRDVIAILERSIDKRIRLVTELSATRSFVEGDPHQLQNAVLNLALNARDAMPNGGTIRLATRDRRDVGVVGGAGAEGDGLLSVEVADEGTGITDEVRARMFEPFFTTKPPGKGTGMGLAAVYGTVQRHGGHLEVETKANVGSVFRVLLPSIAEPVAEPRPPRRARAATDRPGRILVIDDEPVVCALVESALVDHGYDVIVCTSPDDGLLLFHEHAESIDLVLLDMIMPRMNGRETFEGLRARRSDVPVLLVSGYSLDDEAERLIAAGAVGFLQKPFTVDQLVRRVEKALVEATPARDVL